MCIRLAEFSRRKRAGAILTLALVTIAGLAISATRVGADGYPSKFSFGQTATEEDVASIAIAIPADGKGLPPGSGDYAKGKQVYEMACAACSATNDCGISSRSSPGRRDLRIVDKAFDHRSTFMPPLLNVALSLMVH